MRSTENPEPSVVEPLVLLVEDYADNREMFTEFLELSGFRVVAVETGYDALARAGALLPDAILMDVSLPDIDGLETSRRLKSDERTRHIPILALTGHALAENGREAREAGCDACLTKPCLPEDLVTEVRRAIARKRG